MKMWLILGVEPQVGTGTQVDVQWRIKPATQSDPDTAMYPKLSPHVSWEHAEQIICSPVSSGASLLIGR